MSPTTRTQSALGVVVGALLVLSACSAPDPAPSRARAPDEPTSQESVKDLPQAVAVALDDIPDVVAEVDGAEITKDDFVDEYVALYQVARLKEKVRPTGQEPDLPALAKQAVDNLIGNMLWDEEYEARGISVPVEDVDAAFDAMVEESGVGSVYQYLATYESGSTEDQVRDDIESALMVDAMVVDEVGPIEPTDAELHEQYDLNKAQVEQSGQPYEIPSFAETRGTLVAQMKGRRISEAAQKLAERLRQDADITIYL